MSNNKKLSTKTIATTGILLAVCIVFQLLKSISVYITGPAVNAVLILAVLSCGLLSGAIIAIITPLVAYLLGATPILQVIPLMLPVIMCGNLIIVLGAYFYKKYVYEKPVLGYVSLGVGAVLKACFLGLMVSYVMLPIFGANIPEPQQAVMRTTFSVTQLITAAIGIVLALIVWRIIGRFVENDRLG